MRDRRRKNLKTTLQLVSNLLWVAGLVVGLSGIYLLLNYRHDSLFFSHNLITLPAILAISSAAVLVVSGCLGSGRSIRDSTFIQGLFVYLLVVIFCLECTAAALAYFHSTKLDSELAPLSKVFQNYTGSSQDPNTQAVDAAQKELHCCGVHDFRDWLNTSWFNSSGGLSVPRSCCNSCFPSCNGTLDKPWQLYSKGCKVKVETAIQFVLSLIIWGSPVVFLVELVLFLTVGQLMIGPPFTEYQALDNK
uniref:tetraspanin 37 n=1 Tax=Semicossyphus pulcher TaxID=241346 RepID=UPI0037E8367B